VKKYNKFSERLLRGGFWRTLPGLCRSACRFPPLLGLVGGNIGLLVVCLPQGCSSTAARKPRG